MTGIKFGRTYKIVFNIFKRLSTSVIIPDPEFLGKSWVLEQTVDQQGLFVEWDITRDSSVKVNNGVMKITNLPEEFRKMLRKDNLTGGSGVTGLDTKLIQMDFQFGYRDYQSKICFMEVNEGSSEKNGTEWVTTLHLVDGVNDLTNTILDDDFIIRKGEPISLVLTMLLGKFPMMKTGIVDEVGLDKLTTLRDRVFHKGTKVWDIIHFYVPTSVSGKPVRIFIDNGTLNIMKSTTVIDNPNADVISEENGLLDIPVVKEQQIEVLTLCEPRLVVGQYVKVESNNKLFKGLSDHQIFSIKHKGDSMTGQCTSKLTLQILEGDFERKF